MNRFIKLLVYFARFIYHKSIYRSDKYIEVLYDAVRELGGVYIKLIQFVCLRTDVFGDKEKIKFLGFYDAVPCEQLNPQQVIRKEVGVEKLHLFSSISPEPFASGTFGQVYKGELTDGTSVVIKIKRANVKFNLALDFFILTIAARLFSLIYYQRIINVPALIREFKSLTFKELDYLAEAQNGQYFRSLYKDHRNIFIPRTYLDLCTNNILVQEYVGGVSIISLIKLKSQASYHQYRTWLHDTYKTDMHVVLKSLAYELALQGLLYDYFYADPHPGNIKILPNNRYALIDFGIVGTSPRNRRNYYDIVSLIVAHAEQLDMKGIGKEFLRWGAGDFYTCIEVLDEYFRRIGEVKLTDLVTEKYMHLLETKRERFREIEQVEKENFAKMYLDIIRAGQNLQVKVPEGLLALLKTVAVYKSWNEFLEPELHHMRETYISVLQNVDRSTLLNLDEMKEKRVTPEEAIEKILDWVGSVAEFDLPFFTKLQTELKGVGYV